MEGDALKKVAAAVAFQDGKVLVARRASGEKLAGMWEFPGGKLEPEETVQQCIVRELAEELGVRASAGAVLAESTYTYEGGAIHLIAVEVLLHESSLRLSVHDECKWVTLGSLLEMELAPADIPIAEEIIRKHG